MKYFTGDPHLNHSAILTLCGRPYPTIGDWNNAFIENCNSVVGNGDVLYILGDVGFGKPKDLEPLLRRLNGHLILINAFGRHELAAMKLKHLFDKVTPMDVVKVKGVDTTLCHFKMAKWHKSHYNAFHLFAHSHGRSAPIGKSHDVGVDNNNFMPLSEDEVFEIMANRPDNPDLIRK